ncbi:MAG: UvrD-helicase domain-containing protein [Phycicoccus sp.]
MNFTPTAEQAAVIDAFRAGDNLAVSAYAGAGKTSTLVQAAAATPTRRGTFTAFNRKIITDSQRKFGSNVRCATTHSLATEVAHADGGWRWARMKAPRLYGRPLAQMLRVNDAIPVPGTQIVIHPSRAASLAVKMLDRYAASGDDRPEWWHLPVLPGIDGRDARKFVGSAIVPAARRAWADATNPNGRLRYTHDFYRKEWALTRPRIAGDFILVDEAQDSAGVLIRLLEDQQQYGMQVVTVGDSYQAINGWAGAVDSMDKFGGTPLRITQSFRFGGQVAEEANKWLRLLGAPVPLRGNPAVPSVLGENIGPDAVLCKTNGTVVTELLDRLTTGQRVGMLGRPDEITNFTRGARDLMERGSSSHPDLSLFTSWGQVQAYVEDDETGADLKVMVRAIDKHGVDTIEQAMGRLAPANRADVVLSTSHKCKGAEWGKVQVADDFRQPAPDDYGRRLPTRELAMLAYVTVTRAKQVLDRGSLDWVDEAVSDLTGAPTDPATPGQAPVPAATTTTLVTSEPPPAAADEVTDEFRAAVRKIIASDAKAHARLLPVHWIVGARTGGALTGYGRGSSQWVTVTGSIFDPVITWHRYRTDAEQFAGTNERVPA